MSEASYLIVQPQQRVFTVQPRDASAPSAPAVEAYFIGQQHTPEVFTVNASGGRNGQDGADGADGADATVHARRYEESGDYIYCATAPAGSAEGGAVWRITRITYASGVQTATGVATNVTWTGRAGHSYS